MADHGGRPASRSGVARSRLADYVDMVAAGREPAPEPGATGAPRASRLIGLADLGGSGPSSSGATGDTGTSRAQVPATPVKAPAGPPPPRPAAPPADGIEGPDEARRRLGFAALLGEFRRRAVLVPVGVEPDRNRPRDEDDSGDDGGDDSGDDGGDGSKDGSEGGGGLLSADLNGVRWILAFSDEAALARFALARGEGDRAWPYRRILGALLLDVAVGAAGVPCGVALDAADGVDGMVFPPVRGIVPDAVAVDRPTATATGTPTATAGTGTGTGTGT